MSLQKGLVGHWPLDSEYTANGTTKDVSGRGYHASLYNGVTTGINSPVGDGFSFDGMDDYVDLSWDEPNRKTGRTFSIWVKATNNNSGTWRDLLRHQHPNSTYDGLQITNNDEFRIIHDNGTDYQVALTPVITGEWVHLVGMYNGSNVTLYVNGNKVDQASFSGTLVSESGSLFIGDGSFEGSLSDGRIYDRALSDSEIEQLYNMKSRQRWRV